MARKTRKFAQDDLAVWQRVQSTIRPMEASDKRSALSDGLETKSHSDAALSKRVQDETQAHASQSSTKPPHLPINPLDIKRLGAMSSTQNANIAIDLKAQLPVQHVKGLHRTQRRAIQKGKLEVDYVIDLHGMRLEQAYTRLSQFLTESRENGARTVLVVTGKGGHRRVSDFGVEVSGVIKRAFPEWMRDPANAVHAHSYCPAHIKHGGDGAWYVFLRNPTKSEGLKKKHRRKP